MIKNFFAKLKKFFITNWLKKLISFIIALIFWFYISIGYSNTIKRILSIQIKNIPQNMMIMNNVIDELEVKISGEKSVINDADFESMYLYVDLTGATIGEEFYNIRVGGRESDLNYLNFEYSPSSIKIKLDKKITKDLPIELSAEFSPRKGFTITDMDYSPKAVTVEGPSTVLDNYESVKTENLKFDNVDYSFKVGLNIIVKEDRLEVPDNFRVWVNVEAERLNVSSQKIFTNLEIEVKNKQEKFKLNIQNGEQLLLEYIIIEGEKKYIDKITEKDINPYLNFEETVEPIEYNLPVKINLPEDIKIKEYKPKNIKVHLLETIES